jgi:hypothetical protein
VRRETRRLHHWPVIQLNVWLIVVLSASATCLGIFSWFMIVQSQMDLGTPWYVFKSILESGHQVWSPFILT